MQVQMLQRNKKGVALEVEEKGKEQNHFNNEYIM